MIQNTISEREANQRFDKYLKKLLSEANTSFIYKMLRKKNITLNGKKSDGSDILRCGDQIAIFFSDETYAKMTGKENALSQFASLSKIPYSNIHPIYEDDDILALNKPAGILSQKAKDGDISINEEMLSYLIHSGSLTEEEYHTFHPSIANRLDRNTSGLILCGKTLQGQQYLSSALKERSCKKLYHAVVLGEVKEESTIHAFLRKDPSTNKVTILDEAADDAKEIHTAYKPLLYKNGLTLLEVHLITGRSHQIRAHLASCKHPILFDPKYGDRRANAEWGKRYDQSYQLLHAYSIEFEDGRVIRAEEPEIFHRVLGE